MRLEVNTPIAKHLYKISPAPKKIPEFLYHVTHQRAIEKIMAKGIRPHPIYGEIYLAESIQDALMFAKEYRSFVITVNTNMLEQKLIRVSEDHERKVYDCNCFCYFKSIPLAAIVDSIEGPAKTIHSDSSRQGVSHSSQLMNVMQK
jgi:hypothetical protein